MGLLTEILLEWRRKTARKRLNQFEKVFMEKRGHKVSQHSLDACIEMTSDPAWIALKNAIPDRPPRRSWLAYNLVHPFNMMPTPFWVSWHHHLQSFFQSISHSFKQMLYRTVRNAFLALHSEQVREKLRALEQMSVELNAADTRNQQRALAAQIITLAYELHCMNVDDSFIESFGDVHIARLYLS